ncbi:MAG TPA: SPFH domain-containing protein [Xanthobacteraceae bacterium]|nr:SPFH domain-containing protein [Xanthobacteraceae bacterium]
MVSDPESLDEEPLPATKRGWRRFIWRHLSGIAFGLMVTLLLIVVLWPYSVITIPSGQVGVLWYRLIGLDPYCWCFVGRGTVLDPRELREEGLHVIAPWNMLFVYDLRLQSATQIYNAISKDGVNVNVQISVRFQLVHDPVAVLHKFIGPEYFASVVSPEIGSQTRQVIAQYTADKVYTSRELIQDQIRNGTRKSLGDNLNALVQIEASEQPDKNKYNASLQNSIHILDTLVLSIELPPAIVGAINRQTEQYYQIQEYKFRVEREAEESKRKQIEANGIAAFQQTVSKGISDSYLRWRGIEATLALAQSPNSKIVVIGTGKDGLPVILGNVDTATAPSATPQPGASGTSSPSAASPPGTGRAPGASSTTPGAAPAGGGSTEAEQPVRSSHGGAPESPAGAAAAAASPELPPSLSSRYGLSDIESILSRISGALRPTGSAPAPGTATQPKQ